MVRYPGIIAFCVPHHDGYFVQWRVYQDYNYYLILQTTPNNNIII